MTPRAPTPSGPSDSTRTVAPQERLLAGIGAHFPTAPTARFTTAPTERFPTARFPTARFPTAPVKYTNHFNLDTGMRYASLDPQSFDLDIELHHKALDDQTGPVYPQRDKRVRSRSDHKGFQTGEQREHDAFVRSNVGACVICKLRKCVCASTSNDTDSSPGDDSSVFIPGQETEQEIQPASLPVAESSTRSRLLEENERFIHHNDENADVDLSVLESEGGRSLSPIVPRCHESSSSEADDDDAKLSATDIQMEIAETYHDLMTKFMRRVHAKLAADGESAPSSGARRQVKQQVSERQGNKRKGPNRPGQDRNSDRGSSSPSGDEDSNTERSQHQHKRLKPERRLACPFYKHNPQKYCENSTTGKKYKTCGAAPGFEGMHRLKQHFRSAAHQMPPKCEKCGHQKGLEGAVDQMQLIRMEHGITWESVYAILFPGYEQIPDKCERPEPTSTGRTKGNTDFEDLSTGSSMTPSKVDTELAERIHANMRGRFNHALSDQYIEDQIRACRSQPESTPYTEGLPMLPQPNFSVWTPGQPVEHRSHPQENPQLGETRLLPGHTDFSQPTNIGAPALPLDLAAAPGNGSYDADFQNSQPNTSEFTSSACQCLCHPPPWISCCCFSDCVFNRLG